MTTTIWNSSLTELDSSMPTLCGLVLAQQPLYAFEADYDVRLPMQGRLNLSPCTYRPDAPGKVLVLSVKP